MSDTWERLYCPECKKVNWVCMGNLNDVTAPTVEAVQCWACGERWFLDDEFIEDIILRDYVALFQNEIEFDNFEETGETLDGLKKDDLAKKALQDDLAYLYMGKEKP